VSYGPRNTVQVFVMVNMSLNNALFQTSSVPSHFKKYHIFYNNTPAVF
jgi:hypothetical protein